jgi:hypothetical protein
MIHKVYCSECSKIVEISRPGDLGQFESDGLICPCLEEMFVILKGTGNSYGLFCPSDLYPTKDRALYIEEFMSITVQETIFLEYSLPRSHNSTSAK